MLDGLASSVQLIHSLLAYSRIGFLEQKIKLLFPLVGSSEGPEKEEEEKRNVMRFQRLFICSVLRWFSNK